MPVFSGKSGARFWQTISPEEFHRIIENDSWLNEEQTARLFRMMEYHGPHPKIVQIQVSLEDVERLIRKEKRKRQKLKGSEGRIK